MGRYYNGDIEGKFWFGVQSSTAADRFGVEHSQPGYVNYYFYEEDLEGVQEELAYIEENLGKDLKLLQEFFKEPTPYNDEAIAKLLNTSVELARKKLEEFADYLLGKQIEACIMEEGSCQFEAEL
jgi:hypothetical protein